MENKSTEIADLLMAIKEPLTEDWQKQRELGQRQYDISFKRLQADMYDRYGKEITKNVFKTAYIYQGINNEPGDTVRKMSLDRLKIVLRYFYEDIAVPHGWPATTKFLREFAGGKYHPLIAEIVKEKVIDRVAEVTRDYGALDTTTDEDSPLHIQIMQLAGRAKRLFKQMESKTQMLERELKKKREIRDDMIRLETLLSVKGGDKTKILEELKSLKQKVE